MSVCQKCGRVIECDDYEYFEEENRRRSSTALPTNNDYLKDVLRKLKIDQMFSYSEVDFLGNVIAQFKRIISKPVNYSCFLYNYFEKVPSECWPNKKETMKSIYHHLPKDLESSWRAKLELDCEQSLFCSKIPAGGAARKRVRYSSREPRAASREPRAASRE